MTRWLALGPLCLLLGCPGPGFDARGGDVVVRFSWTIAGEAADAAACAAIAATRARLVVRNEDGRWTDPDFVWSCDAGEAATGAVFEAATLDFGLELLDPGGTVVAWSAWTRRTVAPGDNAIGTFDLEVSAPPADASATIRWTVGGAPADAGSCAAAGGESVQLDWRVGRLEGEPFVFPCVDGTGLVEAAWRSGVELDFRLRLVDADGFTVSMAPRASWFAGVTLDPGANALEVFALPTAETYVPLAVLLYWADEVGEGADFVSCETSAVARVGYRLENAAGAVVDATPLDPEPLACTDYLTWPALLPDTYTVFVEAEGGDDGAAWSAECWGLEASDPTDNTFVCRVPRVR